MLAGRGWLVTTAGWVGMAVTAVAWPVTTPLESVSVRRCVLGLSGRGMEVVVTEVTVVERVDWAVVRAARARARRVVVYCILEMFFG